MKKFFKTKEAGTITPLPPTSPAASSSSFGTPRPFDEYQARVAYQADSNRPLSYQAPTASSRSGRGSSDENGYAQPYPPLQRHSQQYGASDASQHPSPSKNRFSNRIHNAHAAETAYESYSDPFSAHSQPYRPSYDRSNTADFDMRAAQLPPLHANQRQSYQQPALNMAALSPPRSLRPAQQPSRHRHNHSMSIGVASEAAFQNQNGTDLTSLHMPPTNHASTDLPWTQRRRSGDTDDEDGDHDDSNEDDDDADERTPTRAAVPRSAAYPVYSGADGDQDAGEVLISQGRYEETVLREPPAKDKGKGKKLFGFATGAKDKKAKQDRDRITASSPVPRASRDRDDARLMSPPIDSQPLAAHERAREGGWMERWNKRAHQQQAARLQDKEAEDMVASRIGWLSANANDESDWMQILPLIDLVSHSEAASKEAARALRKEFKYGTVDTQRRAVRVWALLTLNASDRFRLQIASRRFLDAVEDTVASSKTPLSVKETMLRVLGVLAFEFRADAELVAVTKCWNKVRPSDRPKDGEPLENDLFEFRLPQQPRNAQPPSRRTSQRYSQQQQQQQQRPRQAAGFANGASRGTHTDMVATAHVAANPASQQHSSTNCGAPQPLSSLQLAAPHHAQLQQTWSRSDLPPHPDTQSHGPAFTSPPIMEQQSSSGTDIVSNLEAAAESMESRSASFQSSANSSAPLEPITFEEDVRRLHEECQIARSNATVLLDTLLQEGLHSDTAPIVDEFYSKVVRSQDLIASQIPWASAQADRAERGSREEALLADLLDAHGRTSEAVRAVDDARRRIEEEEEERQVTERSKVEVRLDRTAIAQDSAGEVYDLGGRGRGMLGLENHASGSRSPSPAAAFSGPAAPAPAAKAVLSPSSGFSSNSANSGVTPRISRPLPVPRSDHSSDSNSTRSAFHTHPVANSLTASIHSTTSTADSFAQAHTHAHSRESSIPAHPHPSSNSNSMGRSLPLTPNLNIDTSTADGPAEDELQTPVVPSEKALGKRRAVSVRYPTPPPVGEREQPPQLPPHPSREVVGAMGGLRIGH